MAEVINTDSSHVLILDDNDGEIMDICRAWRPDQSVDGCTGLPGRPRAPRGKFLEQMAASSGSVSADSKWFSQHGAKML